MFLKKKDRRCAEDTVFTAARLDRLLARIGSASAALGAAAAAVVFVVLSLLLPVALYPWNEALVPVTMLLLLLFFLLWLRLRRQLVGEITVTAKAGEYFAQASNAGRAGVIIPSVLLGIGLLLAGYLMLFSANVRADMLCAVCISLSVIGCFYTVFGTFRRVFYKKVKLRTAEGDIPDAFDRRAERRRAFVKWSVYWGIVIAVYVSASLVFRNFYMYALIPVLAAVNFILRLAVNNPFSAFSGVRARRAGVRIMNLCSLAVTVLLCFAVIAEGSDANKAYIDSLDYSVFSHTSGFTYDSASGVYTLRSSNREFRILQLTDIHICGSISTVRTDRASFDACYDLIRRAEPDLIIVTGDISYTIPIQTFSRDNLLPIYRFCEFMNDIGIPWAMVYGNHDTESAAGCTAAELSQIFGDSFQSKPGCPMLYAGVQPSVYGRYNQYIRIENPDGSLNRIVFLIDSNDYIRGTNVKKYDSVHEDQIQWYSDTIDAVSAAEGRRVPSFVFMHIPFRAFADAKAALEAGRPEAVYLFGSNGEGVSCSERDTGFFERILEKGSTDAVFVGHDHLNNMGIKYRGVDLICSKSIDYIAYPGISKMAGQRGGTLITLTPDGGYSVTQLSCGGR